ncbi:MAG: UPF0262 family protein [Hyphomicrobiaceae bacterium]|nr:UPF0262 family protein [Hyphomicrobiaceae bacterium]
MTSEAEKSRDRLVEITLDQRSLGQTNVNIDHEREVAIFDILDGNSFAVDGMDVGPYRLNLAIVDDRLQLTVRDEDSEAVASHQVPLTPLKRVMKDYFLVCDDYYDAVRTAPPSRIQAIDLNRRTLHDEGSKILAEKLEGKVKVDADTARRLFTLLCALHWKG